MRILEFIFQDGWHFIGFTVLFTILLKAILYLVAILLDRDVS